MQNPNRQSCERKHGTKWNNKAKWQRTTCQESERDQENPRERASQRRNMYSPPVSVAVAVSPDWLDTHSLASAYLRDTFMPYSPSPFRPKSAAQWLPMKDKIIHANYMIKIGNKQI